MAGCQDESGRVSDAELIRGVKMSDLRPAYRFPSESRTEVNLAFIYYEIPVAALDEFQKSLTGLFDSKVYPDSEGTFKANGLRAAYGKEENFQPIAVALGKAHGIMVKNSTIIAYDASAKYVDFGRILEPRNVLCVDKESGTTSIPVTYGHLIWQLSTSLLNKTTAQVKMMPLFSPLQSTGQRFTGVPARSSVSFPQGAMSFKLSAGDFVFIWPGKYDGNNTNLSSTVFKGDSLKKIDTVKLFLVACRGIRQE